MANEEHLKRLNEGVNVWNQWREEHPEEKPDLSGANLFEASLSGANLSGADLRGANLGMLSEADLRWADLRDATLAGTIFEGADLFGANLSGADLGSANLSRTNLENADLSGADLNRANFTAADLSGANLSGANLQGADLRGAILVGTVLTQAKLDRCFIYGIAAWDLQLEGATQSDLVITPIDALGRSTEPTITIDNLEVAQFVYLLLHNEKIRHVIDTITSKTVLILGRFTEDRKAVLDAIREELRKRDYVPILFDFNKPDSKDVTGTVETLARMARFIIAELTDPSSIPHELATIVPFLRTTPVLPLRLVRSGGYTMFKDLQRAYSWVMDTHEYEDSGSLISALPDVIAPADEMAEKLRKTLT